MILARLRTVFTFSLAFLALAAGASAAPAATAYKGVILIDASTGATLFEDNADLVSPPASVTKLMTFLIVYEQIVAGKLTLETPVPIAVEDYKMGGTQVWLEPKETFSIDELLYALMIQSANDAASALARASAGSREAFVVRMNERARALGMTHTTFRTPHGLPPASRKASEGDLTSPRDLALLSRELLLKTDILRYTSTQTRRFGEGTRAEPVVMRNHNHLLGKVPGVDGLKTGFTNGAGFCLAATVQRGDKRLIAVIMGSPSAKVRDLHLTGLIDKGFALVPATSSYKVHAPLVTPAGAARATPSASAASLSPIAGPAVEEPADDATTEAPSVRFILPGKK